MTISSKVPNTRGPIEYLPSLVGSMLKCLKLQGDNLINEAGGRRRELSGGREEREGCEGRRKRKLAHSKLNVLQKVSN